MDDDDIHIEEDEGLKAFLPQGFGKSTQEANVAAQIEKSKRGGGSNGAATKPALKPALKPASGDSSDDSDDSDDEDDEEEFPVSHELVLKTHEKAVTTLTADASGARLISGSTDCTLKFHDFASMTPSTLRSFKSVDPEAKKDSGGGETHPIHHVSFNPNSPAQILVVTANPQARIFSRDGEPLVEFVKGDMYLRDMHNTKGHVSEITTGCWHPDDRNLCVTAGTDSTLRIWDVNVRRSQKDVIVHKSRAAGSAGRTRMTAVAWGSSAEGTGTLVAAALDGSLAMWPRDGPYTRPAGEIRDAHKNDSWTSGVAISPDGRTVVSRGGDNTIKLWDLRKFKTAISTVSHPSTSAKYPTSNICFSPTGNVVLTGSQTGHLHILNPATLRPEHVTAVTPNSPLITVNWHPKLNQIITGSANAETHVLYSPTLSVKGAATVMSKAPKRRHIDDDPSLTVDQAEGLAGEDIVTPHGLLKPAAASTASRNKDPRRPHIPATTPFAKSQPAEEHIKTNIPLSSMRDEDPREALLKYAEKAQKDPMFTKAWQETQPNTIYRELSDDEEAEPDRKKAKTS